jgi:membrane protein YdbS with pleckstrin-like domain
MPAKIGRSAHRHHHTEIRKTRVPDLHTKHSLFEKLYFRSMILGAYGIGVYAIFLQNIWIAAAYLIVILLSLELVVYRFCSHCPYPCRYGNCLMMPYQNVTKYAKAGARPMTLFDRLTFPLVMLVLLPLVPQYWLFQKPPLFILFWAVFIVAWASMLLFKCRHCRYKECLFNMTK